MTDEYLKMVLALPDEFFDGWEWKEGDQFIRYNHEWEYIEIQGHVGNYSLYSYTGKICNINETGDYVEGDLRPVPSQEQLQNKISDHWKKTAWCGYTPLSLLSEFRIFVFEKCEIREFIENKTTIIEMLLMFLMSEIYDEKWDGERWL